MAVKSKMFPMKAPQANGLMVSVAHANMGQMGDPRWILTSLIRERQNPMSMNGKMVSENILGVLCHLGRSKKEYEMESWDCLIEANIYSVRVDPERKEIGIELAYAGNGKKAVIVAEGVDYFVLKEMRISNVIDRVQIFGVDDVADPAVINSVFFLLQGRLPNLFEIEWPALQQKLNAIRNKYLTLMEIEPVYGARILLLAKRIELQSA
jgi:hypothetical protein